MYTCDQIPDFYYITVEVNNNILYITNDANFTNELDKALHCKSLQEAISFKESNNLDTLNATILNGYYAIVE